MHSSKQKQYKSTSIKKNTKKAGFKTTDLKIVTTTHLRRNMSFATWDQNMRSQLFTKHTKLI